MLEYHALLLVLLVGTQAFFTALSVLNVRHAEETVTANREWLAGTLGVDDHEELLDYHRLTTGVGQLSTWVTLLGLLLVLYLGGLTWAVEALEGLGLGPVAAGVAFFVGLLVASQVARLPFDAVDTFVVEELFGFNRATPRLWARDKLVGVAVSVVLTGLVVGVVLWLVKAVPAYWWLLGWAFVMAFSLAMQVVYPRVIAPLFNDFEPVETGDLREAIEDVFDRAGFTTSGVYEMDASRRSSHVNAYFVGFGDTKRVVLFDTLTERLSVPEVQSVLAHELAHWKLNHIWKRLAGTAVRLFVVFAVLGYLVDAPWLYAMFGLPTDAAYAGLLLAALFVYPVLDLTAPLENRLSLSHEREADDFAVDVMGDAEPMTEALAGLAQENLANPFPHPWYATFHYTHPPIPERIRRIDGETGGEPDGAAPADD